jgi:hypothetical protein
MRGDCRRPILRQHDQIGAAYLLRADNIGRRVKQRSRVGKFRVRRHTRKCHDRPTLDMGKSGHKLTSRSLAIDVGKVKTISGA